MAENSESTSRIGMAKGMGGGPNLYSTLVLSSLLQDEHANNTSYLAQRAAMNKKMLDEGGSAGMDSKAKLQTQTNDTKSVLMKLGLSKLLADKQQMKDGLLNLYGTSGMMQGVDPNLVLGGSQPQMQRQPPPQGLRQLLANQVSTDPGTGVTTSPFGGSIGVPMGHNGLARNGHSIVGPPYNYDGLGALTRFQNGTYKAPPGFGPGSYSNTGPGMSIQAVNPPAPDMGALWLRSQNGGM